MFIVKDLTDIFELEMSLDGAFNNYEFDSFILSKCNRKNNSTEHFMVDKKHFVLYRPVPNILNMARLGLDVRSNFSLFNYIESTLLGKEVVIFSEIKSILHDNLFNTLRKLELDFKNNNYSFRWKSEILDRNTSVSDEAKFITVSFLKDLVAPYYEDIEIEIDVIGNEIVVKLHSMKEKINKKEKEIVNMENKKVMIFENITEEVLKVRAEKKETVYSEMSNFVLQNVDFIKKEVTKELAKLNMKSVEIRKQVTQKELEGLSNTISTQGNRSIIRYVSNKLNEEVFGDQIMIDNFKVINVDIEPEMVIKFRFEEDFFSKLYKNVLEKERENN